MASFDEGEVKLFSKYWGNNDLASTEEFWADVYEYYSKEPHDAPLPLVYNPQTLRMVQDLLNCPPGKCGDCCRYKKIKVMPFDVERIVENTTYTLEDLNKLLVVEGDKKHLNGYPNGCPFLKRNRCTIYKYRPDDCYLFPFSGQDAVLNGAMVKQMWIRIRCPVALAVARTVITRALSKGDKLLLPDLTIIPKFAIEAKVKE